ncbi:META domain-containing protein [Plantibacter flavus]|uniref:META domain-containing protein n=1 Tax=Plantibacter flavus TaxID=150123 RepID=UPI003F18BDC6
MRLSTASAAFGGGVVMMFALVGCAGAGVGDAVLGSWGAGAEVNEPHLIFSEDGRVSGSDGCNRLAGSWKATGDTIVVSDVASTLMACPDVDTWLSGIAQATLSEGDDQLTVLDDSGAEIGSLERAE